MDKTESKRLKDKSFNLRFVAFADSAILLCKTSPNFVGVVIPQKQERGLSPSESRGHNNGYPSTFVFPLSIAEPGEKSKEKTKKTAENGKISDKFFNMGKRNRITGSRSFPSVGCGKSHNKNIGKTRVFFRKTLTSGKEYDIIPGVDKSNTTSGCGAVESALPWGGRGRWFKSSHSDQIKPKTFVFGFIFMLFRPKSGFDPPQPPERKSPKIFDHMFDHK